MYYKKTESWLVGIGFAIIAICYGVGFLRSPEQKQYESIVKTQLEQKTAPWKKELNALAQKTNPTVNDEVRAKELRENIESAIKEYEAKLQPKKLAPPPPPPKITRKMATNLTFSPYLRCEKESWYSGVTKKRKWVVGGVKIQELTENKLLISYQGGKFVGSRLSTDEPNVYKGYWKDGNGQKGEFWLEAKTVADAVAGFYGYENDGGGDFGIKIAIE